VHGQVYNNRSDRAGEVGSHNNSANRLNTTASNVTPNGKDIYHLESFFKELIK